MKTEHGMRNDQSTVMKNSAAESEGHEEGLDDPGVP